MPLLFKGLHSTVLFHRPLQPSLGERGFFMPIQKFCDHFAHNFICKGLRAMTGCLILREKVLRPLLANTGQRKRGRKPKTGCTSDTHYENIQIELQKIFKIIGLAA